MRLSSLNSGQQDELWPATVMRADAVPRLGAVWRTGAVLWPGTTVLAARCDNWVYWELMFFATIWR
jgi:hypothetical protein